MGSGGRAGCKRCPFHGQLLGYVHSLLEVVDHLISCVVELASYPLDVLDGGHEPLLIGCPSSLPKLEWGDVVYGLVLWRHVEQTSCVRSEAWRAPEIPTCMVRSGAGISRPGKSIM